MSEHCVRGPTSLEGALHVQHSHISRCGEAQGVPHDLWGQIQNPKVGPRLSRICLGVPFTLLHPPCHGHRTRLKSAFRSLTFEFVASRKLNSYFATFICVCVRVPGLATGSESGVARLHSREVPACERGLTACRLFVPCRATCVLRDAPQGCSSRSLFCTQ